MPDTLQAITDSIVFHELKKKISTVTLTGDDEPAFAAEMAGMRVKAA